MATKANPTNQQIVDLLDRILDELRDLRSEQDRLSASLRRLSEAAER